MFYYIDHIAIRNPTVGDIVKVHSPSFREFFRAKIINIKNEKFHVVYIDFGSTEIIHLSDIFELSEELKKKVKLFKFS